MHDIIIRSFWAMVDGSGELLVFFILVALTS